MKKFIFILIILCLTTTISHARTRAIIKLIDIPVPVKIDGGHQSLQEVKKAIITGCRNKRWTPKLSKDGKITASILVRSKHYVEVEILYTKDVYSILYKSSREMNYKDGRIHGKYNQWVSNLSDSIQRAMER